jgi:N-acetylglutamate synthase-like GNAT family acetyltransferase
MIRKCSGPDLEALRDVINNAAEAYKGIIPADRWHEPYMSIEELRSETNDGVEFWCYESRGEPIGVMGIQDRGDVQLIRHAYVKTIYRNKGVGMALLHHLEAQTDKPILVGTWSAASWAIRFYEKAGFRRLEPEETDRLLRKYWKIPERQIETSVVLADARWRS